MTRASTDRRERLIRQCGGSKPRGSLGIAWQLVEAGLPGVDGGLQIGVR
jgi:hypothetical protein